MSAAIWLPVMLVVALAMEGWAALLHGRVWHGLLWSIHRSHHRRRRGTFEHNDALSALHAPIAIALILYGCAGPSGATREIFFGVGLGMSLFGLAYFILHDGLAHGRLPVRFLAKIPRLARLRDAHRVHHGRGGAPFGFFFGPEELARATKQGPPRARASRSTGRARSPRARA